MSRGPGLRAIMGVCGPPGGEWGGRGRGGVSVGGCGTGFACVVSMCVPACSGAPVWSLVGRAVAVFCGRGKDFADEIAYLVHLLVSAGKRVV